MITQNLCSLDWTMHQVGCDEMIPAIVPGSVYGDLLRAGKMEDPFWKDNELAAFDLMRNDFEYIASFTADPAVLEEDHVLLHFDGLDTIADVYLNDEKIACTNNMHRTWEFEVKHLLKKTNELRIYFHSPIAYAEDLYEKDPFNGVNDAIPGFSQVRKAHCMYGWDWGAHLPDAGIWRPVYLQGYSVAKLESVLILQHHEEGRVQLELKPDVIYGDPNEAYKTAGLLDYELKITAPTGEILVDTEVISENGVPVDCMSAVIEAPELWWPNGYGAQPLYTVKVTLKIGELVLDTWEKRIGLRTVTMSRDKLEAGGEEFATTVNGLKIFAMGADYIPEDHLLGRVTPETTRTLLEKAAWAHHNCIRVWGGGYYPDDWFYDICDELGLLVWQDMMFACSMYSLTEEFDANVRAEFRDNLLRLRHHASLALISGNNEVEEEAMMPGFAARPALLRDYLNLYEYIISGMVKELCPQTFYWPSSPSSGGSFDAPQDPTRGDQHYWMVWHGNEPFTAYRQHQFRYLSEFGFQSFPSEKTVDTFTDDPKDKNIFSYVMERHQRNGSANGKIMNYMQQTYLYPTDFNTLIYASQLLQADGIRYGVEHFRRNRGVCMGTVVWQLNDCWPVASWSSIDYTGRLKALHYYEKRFFAPIMISCEENGMVSSGKPLNRYPYDFEKSIRLCVANETWNDENITVNWAVRNTKGEVLRAESEEIVVKAFSSTWLDKVDLSDLKIYDEYISYEAVKDGQVVSSGTVNLSYPKYFHYEDPELTATVDGKYITVSAKAYAKSVEIQNGSDDLILSDNFFDMNAGTVTVEVLSGDTRTLKLRSVYDIH